MSIRSLSWGTPHLQLQTVFWFVPQRCIVPFSERMCYACTTYLLGDVFITRLTDERECKEENIRTPVAQRSQSVVVFLTWSKKKGKKKHLSNTQYNHL
jgi:hypothetical protein